MNPIQEALRNVMRSNRLGTKAAPANQGDPAALVVLDSTEEPPAFADQWVDANT